ncbi:hypothetical protein HDU96_000014 [Phlyctochytrium bullatum]|nr:hypothetical protein HDU96_000014 [Phlyctochytrium bullatum]
MDNWIDDLLIAKPDCPFPGAPEGAKIHLGFLTAWNIVRENVTRAINESNALYPDYELWFTGHSLGGDDNGTTLLCSDDLGDLDPAYSRFLNQNRGEPFPRLVLEENKDCANRFVGILFLDASLGSYQVFPFLLAGWSDPSILKSKIPGPARTEIVHIRNNTETTIAVSYALLLVATVLNIAIDSSRRIVHLLTIILITAAITPAYKIWTGPAYALWKGKGRLSAANEVIALYDLGLTVGVALAGFGLALVINMNDRDVEVETPKKKSKKE